MKLAHLLAVRALIIAAVGLSPLAEAAFSNATLSGDFAFTNFHFNSAVTQSLAPTQGNPIKTPKGFVALEGITTYDGNGNFTRTFLKNVDGTVSSNQTDGGTYTVAADGSYSATFTSGTSIGDTLTGHLNITGDMIVTSSVAGTDPRFGITGKMTGGPYSVASFNGTASVAAYAFSKSASQPTTPSYGSDMPAPKGFYTIAGTKTFDGLGGFSMTATGNLDGVAFPFSPAGSYTVAADGSVGMTFNTGGTASGHLVNGNTLLLASSLNGDDPFIIVASFQTGTYSNASFKGRYNVIDRYYDPSAQQPVAVAPGAGVRQPTPKGFQVGFGTIIADGNGHWSAPLQLTVNSDGIVSTVPFSGTYTVASDGTLTLTSTQNNNMTGHVQNGGNTVYVVSAAGNDPELVYATRSAQLATLNDFNGDGKSDLLWSNTNGAAAFFLMNGKSILDSIAFGPYSGWSIKSGNNDFNGDGKSDLLWTHTNGAAAFFLMDGTTILDSIAFGPYSGWSIKSGNSDFNGDGKSDLLWSNTNGAAAIFLMDGTTILDSIAFGPYPGWSIVSGNSDFNGDGKTDLLWSNTNGAAALFLMDGTTILDSIAFGPYPGWSIVSGTSDFNGDGKSDLLWSNTNGAAALFLMDGKSILDSIAFGPYSGWSILSGNSDFNGDGKSDLLWSNTNGAAALFLMDGKSILDSTAFGPYAGWSILSGNSDFNGDGKSDLLWSNTNGAAALFLMDGKSILDSTAFGPYSGWSAIPGTTGP